jgi:protein TonB
MIEEVYEEPMIEEVYEEPTVVEEIPTSTPKADLFAQKEIFKSRIRENIITNKRYPRMAKRRRIQGTVHVVFDINNDGMATHIRTSGASNLLQKATKRSIKKSFPIDIPSDIADQFPMRNISINVEFILE